MTVYVLTLEGEPQYVTRNLEKIRKECEKWFYYHDGNYSVQRDFSYWLEDRDYPTTDEGHDAAWAEYIDEQFENGTWGDYAWYETSLVD